MGKAQVLLFLSGSAVLTLGIANAATSVQSHDGLAELAQLSGYGNGYVMREGLLTDYERQ